MEKGSYRDLLFEITTILRNTTNDYYKLANGIFNGLDMFNDVLSDCGNDLTESKANGIEFMKSIMPNLRDSDLDKTKKLVCEIFVNANRHFMGSRVVQHKKSGESRCCYADWDYEKNNKGAKKCEQYLFGLGCAILNDDIFTPNLSDVDEEVISLAIEKPESVYEIGCLKQQFRENKGFITEETKKRILFHQRLIANKLELDYLNEFLFLLLSKVKLNKNVSAKLNLISNFWQYFSSWCNIYEGYNDDGENVSTDPTVSEYEWLIETKDPDRPSYHYLKNILNIIMIQTKNFSEENLYKLSDNSVFAELSEIEIQPKGIKQLIVNKTKS